jgi:hypothetical protein
VNGDDPHYKGELVPAKKLIPPPIGVQVLVNCEKFRCLGVLGEDGIWRNAKTSEMLPEVFGWEKLGP